MTVPLPGGYADELLRHLGMCPTCRATKIYLTQNWCPKGRELIRLTTEQRHGRIDK